jgi:hypothetical protein
MFTEINVYQLKFIRKIFTMKTVSHTNTMKFLGIFSAPSQSLKKILGHHLSGDDDTIFEAENFSRVEVAQNKFKKSLEKK